MFFRVYCNIKEIEAPDLETAGYSQEQFERGHLADSGYRDLCSTSSQRREKN